MLGLPGHASLELDLLVGRRSPVTTAAERDAPACARGVAEGTRWPTRRRRARDLLKPQALQEPASTRSVRDQGGESRTGARLTANTALGNSSTELRTGESRRVVVSTRPLADSPEASTFAVAAPRVIEAATHAERLAKTPGHRGWKLQGQIRLRAWDSDRTHPASLCHGWFVVLSWLASSGGGRW
jgi:hypothetical protein